MSSPAGPAVRPAIAVGGIGRWIRCAENDTARRRPPGRDPGCRLSPPTGLA